jgi:hypothetical protein
MTKGLWPHPLLLRSVVPRAVIIWILLHGILWTVSGGDIIQLSARAALLFAGFTAWLGYIDAKRRNELLFFCNLGIHPASIPVVWFLVVVVLESLLSWTMMTVAR